jgi:NAD(P)-dependent dehydrogenase (short-subunit alcohol dehydrogenase family)
MEAVIQELRYASRRLARTPAFTLIALDTLSIAIGASTAAFSLVNGVLLKPLGFERPNQLVYLHGTDARKGAMMLSAQGLIDFRNQTHSFTSIAAVESQRNLVLLRPNAHALRVNAARVGADFFSVLGTHAQLGRTFARGEDARTATKVVVLSDGAWKRYFGAKPGIVGTQVRLDGVLPLLTDVTQEDDCAEIVAAALERFGRLDILVNNAGRGVKYVSNEFLTEPTRFWEVTPETWRMVIDTNVNGPFMMARHAVPVMLKAGWGRIVNVSVSQGTMRRRGFSLYGPSKAALESETIIWAQDLDGTAALARVARSRWNDRPSFGRDQMAGIQ